MAKKKVAGAVVAETVAVHSKDLTKAERQLRRPEGCRTRMRNRLARDFDAIVEGFIEVAKTGSIPHVKLATELLKPTRVGTSRKKSSAARLLEEL